MRFKVSGLPPAAGDDSIRTRRGWLRRLSHGALALWPQWPLAAAMVVSGGLNILAGMRYNLAPLSRLVPLASVAESLAALGSSTQIILGAGLVLVGVGLIWRLAAAWTFAVLLLLVTVAVNLFRGQQGASLLLPAVMLLVLVLLRRYFTRRTILANYVMSLASILVVLAYGVFGNYLLGAGFHPPIRDLISSFYFTIITISTVGYGDITPATPETRLFVISLLIVGLSIFATAIASALGPAISSEVSRILVTRGVQMKRKDHVILVGDGPIARNTARELAGRKIPFVRIIAEESESQLEDQPMIKGDPTDDAVLQEAGIKDARMVIAARDDDGENAFIALVAKDLNSKVRVLAVASSARSIRRLKLARADLVFSPAAVGSRLLADLVEGGEISSDFQDLLEGQPRKS